MAGIEGLVIRGVRAFHPDEEHVRCGAEAAWAWCG